MKDQILGVLKDSQLGNGVRACLVELEFMDTAKVDELQSWGDRLASSRRRRRNDCPGVYRRVESDESLTSFRITTHLG